MWRSCSNSLWKSCSKKSTISFLEEKHKRSCCSPFPNRNPTFTTVYGGLSIKLMMFFSTFLALSYEFKNTSTIPATPLVYLPPFSFFFSSPFLLSPPLSPSSLHCSPGRATLFRFFLLFFSSFLLHFLHLVFFSSSLFFLPFILLLFLLSSPLFLSFFFYALLYSPFFELPAK